MIQFGSNQDLATQQTYREVCRLIGDDTPGDGTDDIIPGGTLRDSFTVFTGTNAAFTRALQITLPASALDEDRGILAPEGRQMEVGTSVPSLRARWSGREIFS